MESSQRLLLAGLVEKHRPALVRFLRRRVRNAEDAEDVAQEAFLRLMRSERVEELENPRGFLFQTAANLAVDRGRQQQLRAQKQREIGPQMKDAAQRDRSSSPEVARQGQERLQQVAKALNELPRKCRRAFVLHRFEGKSHREIAGELGVSRSTVEKYVMRAVEHLRRRLGPMGRRTDGRRNVSDGD